MFWLLSMVALELILEAYLTGSMALPAPVRKFLAVLCGLLLTTSIALLVVLHGVLGLLAIPITVYRIVNLYRMYVYRLPAEQLRTVAFRTFIWLASLQAAVMALAWVVAYHHKGGWVFDAVVAVQLGAALVLLRAATHTWQHAAQTSDPVPISDADLPPVSVLVPARNETDDLQRCLEALVASDYPKLEILVYDDCSANKRTPDIIRSFAQSGVRFIQGEAPDETHWLAKNYAYDKLSASATGEILLFCGVDTILEHQTIRRLVSIFDGRAKEMMSVMPQRNADTVQGNALLQAMRYYWEVCLPRSFFKRPPVLSTCWLIRKKSLLEMGGFSSVSHSVTPEAPLAKRAVTTDSYSFIRSDATVGLYSSKSAHAQYLTSVRVRYPQLHRRLELVAICAMLELILFILPLVALPFVGRLNHGLAYGLAWGVTAACLFITYAMVSVGPRLTNANYGWLFMPIAFALDFAMLHISMWKYEFGSIDWKGRNVCIPVMHVDPVKARFKNSD